MIFSIFIITFAIGIHLDSSELSAYNESSKFSLILVIIGFGLVLLIMSLLGVFATLREHVCCLRIHYIGVNVFIYTEILLVIILFVFRDMVFGFVKKLGVSLLNDYDTDPNLMLLIDKIQTTFRCCGSSSYLDYNLTKTRTCPLNVVDPFPVDFTIKACNLPYSCCYHNNTDWSCGRNALKISTLSNFNFHTAGCFSVIYDKTISNCIPAFIFLATCFVCQVACMVLTNMLKERVLYFSSKLVHIINNDGVDIRRFPHPNIVNKHF